MRRAPTLLLLLAALACSAAGAAAPNHNAAPTRVALLKADDLYPVDWRPDGLSPGWARVVAFADTAAVPVNAGVIWGRTAGAAWDSVLRALDADPMIELWNHGWDHALNIGGNPDLHEFRGTTFVQQASHLWAAQNRAAGLGITVTAFGAPGNAWDTTTASALNATSELQVWVFGDPAWRHGLVLPRTHEVVLERITGEPDFTTFQQSYERNKGQGMIILQFHPASYTAEKQVVLEKAVAFLLSEGWTFRTFRQFAETSHSGVATSAVGQSATR